MRSFNGFSLYSFLSRYVLLNGWLRGWLGKEGYGALNLVVLCVLITTHDWRQMFSSRVGFGYEKRNGLRSVRGSPPFAKRRVLLATAFERKGTGPSSRRKNDSVVHVLFMFTLRVLSCLSHRPEFRSLLGSVAYLSTNKYVARREEEKNE